jgi:eukaryotic-like serine/threonine-protein kinase
MRLRCPKCAAVLEFGEPPPAFCTKCGSTLPTTNPAATTAFFITPTAADAADATDAVGGYRLLRKLGEGGMGAVYEAAHPSRRHVAVKLLHPEFATPEALARFRREGRLASALAHPRCVFVLAADEDCGWPYLVLELMPGETLHDLVARRGPLPVEEAVAKILDVAEGLEEVHRLGIVHRDVKPSNCFLEAGGRVKVGDFGLSRSLTHDADRGRSCCAAGCRTGWRAWRRCGPTGRGRAASGWRGVPC